jgi:hypothetical protein
MKAELVFNLNEVGMSEWEDRDKKVIVAKMMHDQIINTSLRIAKCEAYVDNYVYHGWRRVPDALHYLSQDSEPVRKKLMSRSIRMGFDFVLRQRSKWYVNSILFFEYINSIFVPYFNELRETKEFEAYKAVLLMDNCLCDMSDDIVVVLTHERVRIIIFTHYVTHIFQILDVMLFGSLKKHATGLRTLDEE